MTPLKGHSLLNCLPYLESSWSLPWRPLSLILKGVRAESFRDELSVNRGVGHRIGAPPTASDSEFLRTLNIRRPSFPSCTARVRHIERGMRSLRTGDALPTFAYRRTLSAHPPS
jgi:hypothetical protein